MKTLGDPIFATNPDGSLKSRIGTVFFRTPGLVTLRGIHSMQRLAWVDEVNRARAAEGKAPLTDAEADDETANSADLIFTPDLVLIRPDPNRMDLAFKADEELQKIVSKRRIRFLNTHAAKVRDALRERGENWRMARPPAAPDEMDKLLASAKVAISCEPIYWYNRLTGTRYVTAGGYVAIENLPPERFRAQISEIVKGLASHNRLGQPDLALFPASLPPAVRESFLALDPDALDDAALKAACDKVAREFRAALPPQLRVEDASNFEWRNEMCATLTRGTNETNAAEQDLIHGISPEFYRQIEWLPGARVADGELLFDPLFDEQTASRDPAPDELCDLRVRSIIFNLVRLHGAVEYVNVGRIVRSLARRPVAGARRGSVYLIQWKAAGVAEPRVMVARFQKWGIAEHLDEGKDLLRAIVEADEYADYILDRRLACLQLGMNLPRRVAFSQLAEKYNGDNQYRGTTVQAYYYSRDYVRGTASDKVPPERFRNPAFARRFAELMGEAAALDLVVGRRATETGECVFDRNYEVVQLDANGLPARVVVTDHAGSFVDYLGAFADMAAPYADVVRRRAKFVADYAAFAAAYVAAFERKLAETQAAYRARRHAFDSLFALRPFDAAGSGAYRWSRALARLDACDPSAVAAALKSAISA